MAQPPSEVPATQTYSTLDEPITDTIVRDILAIGRKTLAVLIPPLGSSDALRSWDLWGPLLFCLELAITLACSAGENQGGLIFSAVFVLVWVGAAIVTLNAKLLGSRISFFQTVCVMGYCIAPLCIGSFINLVGGSIWISILTSIITWLWCCWAALGYFRGSVPADREMLAVYPVGLFYLFMTWMVMVGV